MTLNYSFSGKNVLITGGSQGIGRQLVQRFHDGGANVFAIAKNAERIQKLRDELPSIRAETVDLGDWEATRKVVESFGTIDHLVNNAAVSHIQQFMDITNEVARHQFDVNVGATVNVTQVMAKRLIELGREGSVVNVSSICARMGNGLGAAMYSASKAALENLTKSMALELGPQKIRVNCVLPGPTETATLRASVSEGGDLMNDWVKECVTQRMIVKRIMDPGEIADLIMFLLSPLAGMIIGESVVMDGGWLVN